MAFYFKNLAYLLLGSSADGRSIPILLEVIVEDCNGWGHIDSLAVFQNHPTTAAGSLVPLDSLADFESKPFLFCA